ncbi:HIT family protein [Alkalimarinus alittae]|uniref:HIT family protein n=1 Tax=Alkalimarinus alittae TaxID=2961619 RepID=A0ABY6MZA1_9ALTE|nr:HIT family protein [Alkalimarinus alittae]UZE95172.1 HIT family protein [Alkalimarinus alittae]
MSNCLFCNITQKKETSSIVYEDDICMAIMDIFPLGEGHILVLPKQHAVLISELDTATQSHLFTVGSKIVEGQRKAGFGVKGTNFLLNDGKAANQTVPHIHLHLIPRKKGDLITAIPKLALHITGLFGKSTKRDKLNRQAKAIKQHLPV